MTQISEKLINVQDFAQLCIEMNKLEELIYLYPEKWIHIRRLATILKVSPNSIRNWAKELLKQELIVRREHANLIEFRGNLENKDFIRKKQVYNLGNIYNSGIVDFLSDYFSGATIILFGSYSRGEDYSESDIDIAVITSSNQRPELSKYEKKLKRRVELSLFTKKDVSKEFMNNLINGIVLNGVITP
ncbi:MAG: hypothetical protein MAG795_01274 [Candidatus Woesearchaeota archaeon]|nr:hypothetical protein [Candidatus Woesearchaeota archaeon]